VSVPAAAAKRLSRGAAIMALAGIGFVGYGLLFFVQNFTGFLELGISHAEVDVGRADIQRFSPSLYHYISHLHIALAGFIAACGVAVAALAWFGVRRGELWAWVTAVVVPVLALAVALPAHYPYNLDTVGHLGLIYADTVLFCVGAALALASLQRVRSPA
jgi:cytochrome bd-type quinol oxidase subunit 2